MKSMGLASPEDIRQNLSPDAKSVLLDVRTSEEIASTGKIERDGHPWIHCPCMPTSTELEGWNEKGDDVPGKDTPIVVYCRSGRRASRAEQLLKSMGYQHVLNGGGYDDMVSILNGTL